MCSFLNDAGAFAGVFTDPQFQVIIRGLSQKKGADLMSAPSVVTTAGQRATIEIIREFGGDYFDVTDGDGLARAYEAIDEALDEAE